MGNTCCSYGGEDKSNVSVQQLSASGLKEVPAKFYQAWLKRYREGSHVDVLFPDGQRIQCKLTLDAEKRTLFLEFKDKVRGVPYKDIESWIYGSSDMDQTSADAKLLKDPKVVGFRLATSGRAIALAFDDTDSAVSFVSFLEQILEECRAEQQNTKISPRQRSAQQ